MSKAFLSLLSIILAVFIGFSCQVAEPNNDQSLSITVEDVSCTEAWIKISAKGIDADKQLMLYRNNEFLTAFTMDRTDTLFFDEGLLPSKTYSYKAKLGGFTAAAEAVTMDTTSHNFTWQTFTFGGNGGSSYLKDVAIINENDIWAVGEIHTKDDFDSSGHYLGPYNAVHWNGEVWELKRLMGKSSPLYAVFAFNENDIWFNGVVRWNGIEYSVHLENFPLEPNGDGWRVNAMWGTSSKDFYVVGNNGNIAHYNGSSWTKIESGTTLNINDIWGDYNEKTKEWEILAVCGNILHGWESERVVLRINNTSQATQLNAEGSRWPLSGIWFKPNNKYYVVGSGIYNKYRLVDLVWGANLINITSFHTNKIKGNNINDIIIVGAYGETLHYNGFTWRSYMNETALSNGTYLSVGIKNNLVIAVGYQSARAVITIGQR
ncbi:MAG: glucosyl transferase [Bacteroidetes bacterium]|nr:glucosyl transferase [Bacteroidota bacterium]